VDGTWTISPDQAWFRGVGTGSGRTVHGDALGAGWHPSPDRIRCLPGTLNVRLADPDALVVWRRIREGAALRLVPPPPETCGARLFRAVVAPDVSAAIVVPDVTRYGDDTLELVAAVHVRNYFGLHDRDLVTLRMPAALAPGSS